MALSNLDSTKLYTDLDALSPRSNTTNDALADQVNESPTGVYTTNGGAGGGEIVVDGNNKKIYFQAAAGNNFEFAGSGITGQALYSFLKYLWKNVESITKFDFPMLSITNEQFEIQNGWYLDDAQTLTQKVRQTASVVITNQNQIDTTDTTVDFRKYEVGDTITITGASNAGITGTVASSTKTQIVVSGTPFTNATESTQIDADFTTTSSQLVRTAGWSVRDVEDSYTKEIYSGVITLGTLVDQVDRPYYVQDSSTTAVVNDTVYTGPANEAVAILARADSTAASGNSDLDIAFSGTNTITSTTTDLSVFKVGDTITVTNTDSNNGTFTVTTPAPTATNINIVETGTSEVAGAATLVADRRSTFKIFVRERGKTYADADLQDIGVTTMTSIVYRFPVTNATDLNITSTADTDISSGTVVPATVNPYDDIQISYLEASAGVPYDIVGLASDLSDGATVTAGQVYKDGQSPGRWFKVTSTGTINAAGISNYNNNGGTAVLAAFEGEREVKGVFYAFTVIIDANDQHANSGTPYVDTGNNTTVEDVYEFCQWALRRDGILNEGSTGNAQRNGNIADLLVEFVGPTLVTKAGVFIDSLASTDQNSVEFTEFSDASFTGASTITYPRVVTVTLNFNSNLATDADAVFYVYYNATPNGNNFGESNALQVVASSGSDVGTGISNNVPDETVAGQGSTFSFTYSYDEDTTGGRSITPAADVDVVAVAIGLDTGQYVKSAVTPIKSTGASISLVAPLERNFDDPA